MTCCHWTLSLSWWYIYRKRRLQLRARASNIHIITIFNVVSSAFPHSTMAVSKRIRILCNTDHFPKISKLSPLLLHKNILCYYTAVCVCVSSFKLSFYTVVSLEEKKNNINVVEWEWDFNFLSSELAVQKWKPKTKYQFALQFRVISLLIKNKSHIHSHLLTIVDNIHSKTSEANISYV